MRRGKFIVLLHPGRSKAAQESAATHTGALAGDYGVMHTLVTRAGVIHVESMEELVDVSQILVRCLQLPTGGPAIFTESGAFKALALDLCEQVGLRLPALSSAAERALRQSLACVHPTLESAGPYGAGAGGSRPVSAHLARSPGGRWLRKCAARNHPDGPGDDRHQAAADTRRNPRAPAAQADDFCGPGRRGAVRIRGAGPAARARRCLLPIAGASHSRAGACNPACIAGRRGTRAQEENGRVLDLPPGILPEYKSKRLLADYGIAIPEGRLARSSDEAVRFARELGFPVALKAQAAALPHKSDAGGVLLGMESEEAVAEAWSVLQNNIERLQPGLLLDGVLVERMGEKGLELIVGARNDQDWGPVLLVGSGGVLAEAIEDVRILAADLAPPALQEALHGLRCGALLRGFRGTPELDVAAVAEVLYRLAQLVRSES